MTSRCSGGLIPKNFTNPLPVNDLYTWSNILLLSYLDRLRSWARKGAVMDVDQTDRSAKLLTESRARIDKSKFIKNETRECLNATYRAIAASREVMRSNSEFYDHIRLRSVKRSR